MGPNLDTLGAGEAAVTNGVGAMPAFNETLTSEQVRGVAAYVSEATKP